MIENYKEQFKSSKPFDPNAFLFNLFIEGSYMHFRNGVTFSLLLIALILPLLLSALPQDLEVFTDFENISGEGEFFIGEEPNRVKLIGFTVESLEDPPLLHSGSKALTLGPGEEGRIFTEKGIAEIEFYVAESTGAGKIEARGPGFIPRSATGSSFVELILSPPPQFVATGLPTSINPDSNPPVQQFVAVREDIQAIQDPFNDYFDGMTEIKFFNVTGKLVIDDLGFTLTGEPRNNTVYTTFNEIPEGGDVLTIGSSPFTATFSDGFVGATIGIQSQRRSGVTWSVLNGETGTITFETPAARVQFYGSAVVERPEQENFTGENDGTIQVFDTEDNLLITIEDLPQNITPLAFAPQVRLIASELGAVGGIKKITVSDKENVNPIISKTTIDDFGFTPIGAPGFEDVLLPAQGPSIAFQPANQEIESGSSASLSVAASGDDLSYQWYEGNSGDTTNAVAGATGSTFNSGPLTESKNYWVQISNPDGTVDSDTAVITIAAPPVPLVIEGTGDIAGENIQHPNGNIFDQVLLTGESIRLQAKPNQITRVSFMDEDEDIVQVEFSGAGTFTVTLDSATFLPPSLPPRYNQEVEYVTGKPSVLIEGADTSTFFSIFTVGSINAVNQALFPEGQVYDAEADVTLVEVINSTGMGGMQLSNTIFSGSTGKVGVDARGVPIAVRLTVGDIDANGEAVPHLLFGSGSFTVAAGNPGLRITGGDLVQSNGASIVVAESGSTTRGFDRLITQNNFKSDNTPQLTKSISAAFVNEDGEEITVSIDEVTIE